MLPALGDVKAKLDAAVKSAAFGAIAGVACTIVLAFLCAALFVFVEDHYGTIIACLVLAGLFLLLAIVAVVGLLLVQRRERQRAARRAREAAASAVWRDPAIVSMGLQIGKALGFKRAAPIVVLGAFVVGLILSRTFGSRPSGEPEADG